MKKSPSKFLTDTIFNFGAQISSLFFGLATTVILARGLGVGPRGELAFALLLPQTLMALLGTGFASTVSYSVASKAWKEGEILSSILGIATYLSAFTLLCAIPPLIVHEQLFPSISLTLLLCALLVIPISSFRSLMSACLVGKRAFRQSMWVSVIANVATVLITATLVFSFPRRVESGLAATILGSAFGVAIVFFFCRQICKSDNGRITPNMNIRSLLPSIKYGGIAQVASISSYLNYKLDQFLIAWLLGVPALGIYVVAVSLSEKLWMFVGNLSTVLFAMAASEKDSAKSTATAVRVARIVFWANILLAIGLALVAKPLVDYMYGKEYAQAAIVVLYLLPGILLLGCAKVTANFLAGTGRVDINAICSTLGVIVNVVANLILIPRYQLVGAAAATSISYTFISITNYIFFVRLTGADWKTLFTPPWSDVSLLYRHLLEVIAPSRL